MPTSSTHPRGRRSARTGALGLAGTLIAARAVEAVAIRAWRRNNRHWTGEIATFDGEEHQLVASDGARIRARVAGSGPEVVLAHGIAGGIDHWAPVANRLVERGHRVVLYDQRGHGSSVAGDAGFGIEALALDLAAVVGQLTGGDPIVGGHSMGGIGIQAFIGGFPEAASRLGGVALVGTASRPPPGPLLHTLSRPALRRAFRRLIAHPSHGAMLMRPGFGRRPALAPLEELRRSWQSFGDEGMQGFGSSLGDFDFATSLEAFTVPSVVICGMLDTVTPRRESERIADHLPNAGIELLPGAGHMVIWERPDTVADLIAGLRDG